MRKDDEPNMGLQLATVDGMKFDDMDEPMTAVIKRYNLQRDKVTRLMQMVDHAVNFQIKKRIEREYESAMKQLLRVRNEFLAEKVTSPKAMAEKVGFLELIVVADDEPLDYGELLLFLESFRP